MPLFVSHTSSHTHRHTHTHIFCRVLKNSGASFVYTLLLTRLAHMFGESGPKRVEVLTHPRRRPSAVDPLPQAAVGGMVRIDSDAVEDAEASDHFEMVPALQRPTVGKMGHPAGQARLGVGRGIERWNHSSALGSAKATASQRFAQPLAAEGQGSVFPMGLALSDRRALEVEILRKFDRLEVNSHVGEFWFIVDAIWVSRWIDFVMGAGHPPGPISNSNLFHQHSDASPESRLNRAATAQGGVMASRQNLVLKEGLKKLLDYRAVHPLVWYIFREIYAADDSPELCRWKADIYQGEVEANRKFKFCEDAHTKAVYELRRFCAKIKEGMQT
ncbi:unnamed protein product [Pylaiella littoralis]